MLAVSGYVFTSQTGPGNISIDYLLFPPLIWIAARFRPRVTFSVCAPLCIGVAWLHARGFGQYTAAAGSLGLQIFLIMILAAALLVTMTRHEYRQLQMRLLENSQRLYPAEDAGQLAAGIVLHDGVGQTLTRCRSRYAARCVRRSSTARLPTNSIAAGSWPWTRTSPRDDCWPNCIRPGSRTSGWRARCRVWSSACNRTTICVLAFSARA